MTNILSISHLHKTYQSGFEALKDINLEISKGEIFALLGQNGVGKTTLISIICGIVSPSSGRVLVDGKDIIGDYREARELIGLVPQELSTDSFETVWNTVTFSRGLYGKPSKPAFIEKILKDLSLWDKRHSKIMTLSGGMKRRVMIAKALSHEPSILFLDEPTAGVDVSLRKDMWNLVKILKDNGTTVILTTHYIEEAEEMADRIGIIRSGELIMVDNKLALMNKLGKKEFTLQLQSPLQSLPKELDLPSLSLSEDKYELTYRFDSKDEDIDIAQLLQKITSLGIIFKDLHTKQSSLEEIFVNLVNSKADTHEA
ncbi:ABC transporter ATP-binding protein [Polynucleobacter paneuropaeus]|uniref:ABC transporter ATP-binding protein n=1 Tax=Polynucleobacter paneuropaeus TaxID=2527775 RepID=A0AAE2YKH5_9BURK|nr:ABC transporter ATP-binding protein [Polynucleobacter paneuropaeus]MBT8591127.1 ABC transporter ATP-binding protein [Polynucleobacter paneuropaeus]MBT8596518.1 ABC transporter ATP-binding protein [Polynucleobacter paneuropaeus]MBT8598331.1 ABC transporter ATP-binding protein [Polynucleobacter paneuropaeus]